MLLRFAASFLAVLAASLPATASSVKVFEQETQKAFLEGRFEGISVDPLGTLRLADRVERVAGLEEEPYVFQMRRHPEGVVLGTGNAGHVNLVTREGMTRTLFSTPEPEVFAVLADDDGTVLAGSSPDGRVYRLAPGETVPQVLFDPEDTYIWALERLVGGDLVVGTGPEGRLYRLSAEAMAGELPVERATVMYDSDDAHIRTLHGLPDGSLLVGTAGNGLVLEIGADGTTRTLFDAVQPEIMAFAVDEEGARYVAALASESSFVTLSAATSSNGSSNDDEKEKKEANGEVSVTEGAAASGTRPSGFKGARSVVARLDTGGSVDVLWRFEKETVYDLTFARGRLWVATGLSGKLFSWQGDRMVLEKAVDEKQIIGLDAGDEIAGPIFATTNAGALYQVAEGKERQGQYTSQVLDAGRRARFGSLHWDGDRPAGTKVEWQVRSGTSAKPDATWTDWSVAAPVDALDLADLPPGRYVQWRATLFGNDGQSPRIDRVELSYLEANQKPEITKFTALEPGEILVPANFNPSNQVYEPVSPNREGIFTTVDGKRPGKAESKRTKKLWKKGFRTLSWTATDPNGDALIYSLHVRPEGTAPGDADGEWLQMAQDLEDGHYAFDSTALPDARYRFRLTASDRKGNEPGDALETQEISASVLVDHSPPTLGERTRDGSVLEVTATDAASPIRSAEWSENAGEWKKADAVDGLLDGRVEKLRVEASESARFLLLRLTDAAHNVMTYSLLEN